MEYLYHATPVENVTSILADGIRPGRSGEVHLANRPEWAAGFVEPHVDSEVFVFAVNVDEIDMELLEVSYTADTHIKARSLNLPPELVVHAYEGTIGACALVPLGVVEFESPRHDHRGETMTNLPRLTPHQRRVYDRALHLAATPINGRATGIVAVHRKYHSATRTRWGLGRIAAVGSAGALARLAAKGYLRKISDDRDAVYVVVPPPTTKETP